MTLRNLTAAVAFFLTLVTSVPSSATNAKPATGPTFYVSLDGSDSNDGSQAHPWATISHADSKATPGSTIHIGEGVYVGSISINASGTSNARIRYLSDIRWGASIVGNNGGTTWTVAGNYVDVIGFDVSGNGNIGIYSTGTSDHIMGNHVHDIQQCGPVGAGGAGIDLQNYLASDSWAIGNVVHDIGIAFAAPGTCSPGAHGIYMNQLRAVAQNNIVYRVQTYCIEQYHAASSTVVANNLAFSCGGGSSGGGIGIADYNKNPNPVPNNHTTVVNNIVRDSAVWGVLEKFCTPGCGPDNLYSANLLWNNGAGAMKIVGGTPVRNVVGNQTVNPSMVNYNANPSAPQIVNGAILFPNADFHLSAGSSGIGAATTTCASGGITPCVPGADIEGGQRPQSSDVGPYQSGSTPATWPWY
jgi:hypothetical protein